MKIMIFFNNEYNEYKTLFWVHMDKTVQHKLHQRFMDYVVAVTHR